MVKIKHGFTGQRLVVYPFYEIEKALSNPLTGDLAVHSMGYFPNADNHYIDRPAGCGEYVLIYCINGKGWYMLDGKRQEVCANQFFILPAEKPHQYGSPNKEGWTIYWAHFKGRKASSIYEALKGTNTLAVAANSRINDRKTLFDELLNVMEEHMTEATITYVNMSFHQLIGSFIYPEVFRQSKYPTGKAPDTFFISKVTHYMNENIDKQITMEEFASVFGYSQSYFYRLFMKETSHSPMSYFHRLKIQRATELLVNTHLKINQIGFRLGFDDPYYFSRLFKNITGLSPTAYVSQNRPDYKP